MMNTGKIYASKDKIESILVEAFEEAKKEVSAHAVATSKTTGASLCPKMLLAIGVLVILVSGITSCAICSMMLLLVR